ncbi:MAG: hypothetical protein AAGF53_02355 [Pseudomonadota bacterium]
MDPNLQAALLERAKREKARRANAIITPQVEPEFTDGGIPLMGSHIDHGPAPVRTSEPSISRGLQLGTQGLGRGIAGLFGLPSDLGELAANAGVSIGDAITGADSGTVDIPLGGQEIYDLMADGVRSAFGNDAIIDRSAMTPQEQVRDQAVSLGTEALLGSSGIRALKDVMPRGLAAPFNAPGSEARVVAGDTAAGVGAGTMLETYDQNVPQSTQDQLGIFGDLFAGLLGGVGGAGALRTTERAADAASGVVGRRAEPRGTVPVDPETAQPFSRNDVGRAATLLQQETLDPAKASQNIADYLASVSGGPSPSTALIADDPGLLSLERRLRSGPASPEFIAADRAVMDDASNQLQGIRPSDGDPTAAREAAQNIIEAALSAPRVAVEAAQANVSEQDQVMTDLVDELMSLRTRDQASRDLDRALVDDTFLPARAEKNRLFEEAADSGVEVGTDATRDAATAEKERLSRSNPALRDQQSQSVADAFSESDGPRGLADVLEDRRGLKNVENTARSQGNFGQADTARSVRKGIDTDVEAAAQSGAPGTEALAAADANFKENFAPYFRDGTVSPQFFKSLDRDPTRGSTPPEATAEKFLRAGSSSKAAAEDVAQILSISPSREEGIAAATEYALADAVGKGVVQNGKVNENALAKYMSQREGMFEALPEVKGRFDQLLADVRDGNAKSNELGEKLTAALEDAKLTERDVNKGVTKLISDSDPSKAVTGVLNRPDPVAAMKEATEALKGDKRALRGWKAAVADHFTDKVTTASKAAVSDGNDTISLPAISREFKKNREALAEVFTPDDMNALQQIEKRLEVMSKRGSQASTGSATAENFGGLRGVLRDLAGPAGLVTMVSRGALMAGSVERRIKAVADQFPDANAAAVKLINQAQFDPALAKHLLDFPTKDEQVYTWTRKLNQMIVAGELADQEEEE